MILYNRNMSTQVLLIGRGLFQDGLDRVLKSYSSDIKIVDIVETWNEAKTFLSSFHPDVIIADYQCADVIMSEMESFSGEDERPITAIFVILDENKMIIYQRRQMTGITIDRLVEAL